MTVLAVGVASVGLLFAVVAVREVRAWRAYQRASADLASQINMARPAEVAGRADTTTSGGLQVPLESISSNGRRGVA